MPRLTFNHHSDVITAITALPAKEVALGLDFDGTLAHFNNDPNAVRMPEEARSSIIKLSEVLNGAVAIITGRDSDFIENVIFHDHRLPASYGHGAFVRKSAIDALEESSISINEAVLDDMLSQIVLPEKVVIEKKPQARAIHWSETGLPEEIIEPIVREIVEGVVERYNAANPEGISPFSQVKAEAGRMVLEIGSMNASKGHAIDLFREVEDFRGRTFVYFGDQPADKSAMQQVNSHGGITIGVGDHAPEIAQYRLQGPDDVHKVINALANNREWAGAKPATLDI